MKSAGFENKILSKLGKLDADQIQQILAQILGQKQFVLGILDHLTEGVIVTNARLDLLFANPRARLMLGLARPRGQQRGNLEALLPPEHPLAEPILSLRGNLREIDGHEAPYGRRRDRYVSLSTLSMRSPGGMDDPQELDPTAEEEPLLIILLQDITERRLRQGEHARARRLASMATLTAGVAHEIKNPLNSLNIHAQLLRDEIARAEEQLRPLDAERTKRASEVILEETTRLGRVVEDFLLAARPRQPDLEERDLAAFLQRIASLFEMECYQRGVALVVNIEPDLPRVSFDEHLMLQALRNLVRNALDAIEERLSAAAQPDSDGTPTVEIAAHVAGETVDISISDNGPGMDAKTLEHIFEPYFTTKFNGTGLGLMVVYRIVTEHKALLNVESNPGQGTRFTISLPIHQRPIRLLQHEPAEKPLDPKLNPKSQP